MKKFTFYFTTELTVDFYCDSLKIEEIIKCIKKRKSLTLNSPNQSILINLDNLLFVKITEDQEKK